MITFKQDRNGFTSAVKPECIRKFVKLEEKDMDTVNPIKGREELIELAHIAGSNFAHGKEWTVDLSAVDKLREWMYDKLVAAVIGNWIIEIVDNTAVVVPEIVKKAEPELAGQIMGLCCMAEKIFSTNDVICLSMTNSHAKTAIWLLNQCKELSYEFPEEYAVPFWVAVKRYAKSNFESQLLDLPLIACAHASPLELMLETAELLCDMIELRENSTVHLHFGTLANKLGQNPGKDWESFVTKTFKNYVQPNKEFQKMLGVWNIVPENDGQLYFVQESGAWESAVTEIILQSILADIIVNKYLKGCSAYMNLTQIKKVCQSSESFGNLRWLDWNYPGIGLIRKAQLAN